MIDKSNHIQLAGERINHLYIQLTKQPFVHTINKAPICISLGKKRENDPWWIDVLTGVQ